LIPELPVSLQPISIQELRTTVKILKNDKAAGPDEHPMEYWKIVLEDETDEDATVLLSLYNEYFSTCTVPAE